MPGTYILYIHASNNIIKPVTIQLDAVENAPTGTWNLPPGRAMAQEVAAQVTRAFPKARVAEQMIAIESLLKFMNPLSGGYLEGLVVRVPGTIDSPPAPAHTTTVSSASLNAQLQQQLNVLMQQHKQQLMQERGLHENERKRLERELSNARQQLQQLPLLLASVRHLQNIEKQYLEVQEQWNDSMQKIHTLEIKIQQDQQDLEAEVKKNAELDVERSQYKATSEQLQKDLDAQKRLFDNYGRNSQKELKEHARLQREFDILTQDRDYYKKYYADSQKATGVPMEGDKRIHLDY